MKILLVDADSKIPNLALMKLSSYHKKKGDKIFLKKLNISYFPTKKNIIHDIPENNLFGEEYDKIYCSVIFDNSLNWINDWQNRIIFGGTGYSLDIKLDKEIENLKPDYSLYPDNDISYGFISRGCIRNCYFCKVPKKEGYIHQVNKIDDIVFHKKVKFMDNNFLALSNHKELLQELINKKIKFQFNQGLDIRLVDKENSNLLFKSNYLGEYFFAFDDLSYISIIEEKLKLLSWRKNWQIKFFLYCNPKMKLKNIIKRIKFLHENKCLPYVMRDISCWGSVYEEFYTDICSWCNQPNLFKNMSFKEFLEKRHSSLKNSKNRINKNLKLYEENL